MLANDATGVLDFGDSNVVWLLGTDVKKTSSVKLGARWRVDSFMFLLTSTGSLLENACEAAVEKSASCLGSKTID